MKLEIENRSELFPDIRLFIFLNTIVEAELAHEDSAGRLNRNDFQSEEIVDEILIAILPLIEGGEKYHVIQKAAKISLKNVFRRLKRETNRATRFQSWDDAVEEDLDFDDPVFLDDTVEQSERVNPENVIGDKETRKLLFKALLELDVVTRFVVSSAVMDDADLDDIAKYLGHHRDWVVEVLQTGLARLSGFFYVHNEPMDEDQVALAYKKLGESFHVDPNALSRYRELRGQIC